MYFLATPHHTINKNLLLPVGLWPHQARAEKFALLCVVIFCMTSQSCLQIAGMIAAWEDTDVFMESIPPVLVDFVCGAKIINFLVNSANMKRLLVVLEDDWARFKNRAEYEILDKYAMLGRRLTISYASCMYGSMAPFMVIPAIPLVLDIVAPGNVSHERQLMFRFDYLIDVDTYYWPLLAHGYFSTMIFITVVVGIDTMFMTYVQHACGCFAVLGYQLEHIVDGVGNDVDVYPRKTDDIGYQHMVDCIAQHNHAIKYSGLIEAANFISYFFQLGFNMICISFTGFQTVMQLDRPQISFRYAAFTTTQLFILFLQSYPAQMLYDHSEQVADHVNNSGWYYTSIRTRKLVNLMTLRSRVPTALTAGKFYVLNLANFSAVVRTSMSYLTVLTSTK